MRVVYEWGLGRKSVGFMEGVARRLSGGRKVCHRDMESLGNSNSAIPLFFRAFAGPMRCTLADDPTCGDRRVVL